MLSRFTRKTVDREWLNTNFPCMMACPAHTNAGRYVTLHVGKEQHLLRETMNDLEAKLDASVFARVHRSAIVNLDRIRELQSESHGEVTIVLGDGRTLRWSRSYRERLETLLRSAG